MVEISLFTTEFADDDKEGDVDVDVDGYGDAYAFSDDRLVRTATPLSRSLRLGKTI